MGDTQVEEERAGAVMRKKVAFLLVRLADRIYPQGKATQNFVRKLVMDKLITGKAYVRLDPFDVVEEL